MTRARGVRAGVALGLLLAAAPLAAARELPPAPDTHVADRANVLSPGAREAIERRLESFEREQGTQILIATFRKLPEGEAIEDWTVAVAEAWRVGRAGQDDGAVLFVFVDDRRLRLEVGYGLEGALTDLESKTILDEVVVPQLANENWDGGLTAGAEAIVTAVRGEYAPTPGARRLARDGRGRVSAPELVFLAFLVLVVLSIVSRGQRGGRHRSGGRGGFGGPWMGGGGFGGGSFGGGGGFGGFSGGGGSFGGGGASGRW